MKISIVIPTYEYNGKSDEMLKACLESIKSQTFTDYEIVISDHSQSDVVLDYVKSWDLPIEYFRNEVGRGNSSINMNYGIKKSHGEYIKILHMDDWFCNNNALQLMVDAIEREPTKKWGGFGFNHFYQNIQKTDRFIMPNINQNIKTLLGCPSVSFFVNDRNDPSLFDENLIIINDSDMHIRLGYRYGQPILINEYCVTIRIHEDQVTNLVGQEKHKNELKYYKEKHLGK